MVSLTDVYWLKNHLVHRYNSDIRNSRKLPLGEAFFHIISSVPVMLLGAVADTDESFALNSLKSSFLVSTWGSLSHSVLQNCTKNSVHFVILHGEGSELSQ